MRSRYILITVVLVTLGFGVGRLSAATGTLDSPDVPGNTQSFTLEDIYNRLNDGTEGAQSTFTEPAAGPGTGTMHTLNDIMAQTPAIDNTSGATETNVLDGKTFWGLTGGQWGAQSGTMPNNGAVTITPTTTNQTIAEGYHDGSGEVLGDTDLVSGNIKSGVEIFGVPGELYGGCTCTGTITPTGGTRWCDNGNGTVTDLTSCLVWLQDANCIGTKEWADTSTNDDAVTWASILFDGSAAFSGSSDCGLSDSSTEGDWRLPTKNELYDLTHGTEQVRSSTPGAFTGVQSHNYWSSTTREGSVLQAWSVKMEDGVEYERDKTTYNFYVWPVRGGQ